jgi:pimeloyl-ACP methyl ester carboxylesterase
MPGLTAGWTGLRVVVALILIAGSLAVLEGARRGVAVTHVAVGDTPVTGYAMPDTDGPVVVIAHGFAGSRQMMQGYALPLARAGYRVFSFDFLGHGRHPLPMSGDVSSVEGTTRLLMAQTGAVIDAVSDGQRPVALLGHSMATDVLARVAAERDDVGPVVLVSAFSRAITADSPRDLLMITGAWEPGLRDATLGAARLVSPGATEGQTVTAGPVIRRAEVAPFSDHVFILQNRVARAAAVRWIDRAYGRSSDPAIWPTGWAILGLLGGLVLIFGGVARLLPSPGIAEEGLTWRRVAMASVLPAGLAPLVAVPLNPQLLPVLVADYLALHLAVFGLIQLGLLRWWRVPVGRISTAALLLVLGWCCLFGLMLDRYVANFWPTPGRFWIVAAMALGAVPFMIADQVLTLRARFGQRLVLRAGFLLSLGVAVALDFQGLFFLLMIAPVVLVFYLIFGTVGRASAVRAGPLASGLALGLVLAWALGVSFPLFAP